MRNLLLLLILNGCATTSNNSNKTATTTTSNVCPKTLLLGLVEPLSGLDSSAFKTATNRCPALYEKSPCLKVFIKAAELTYRAICGAKSLN